MSVRRSPVDDDRPVGPLGPLLPARWTGTSATERPCSLPTPPGIPIADPATLHSDTRVAVCSPGPSPTTYGPVTPSGIGTAALPGSGTPHRGVEEGPS